MLSILRDKDIPYGKHCRKLVLQQYGPGCAMGDFNVVLKDEEKLQGAEPDIHDILDFRTLCKLDWVGRHSF
jgi:hypothetical protein